MIKRVIKIFGKLKIRGENLGECKDISCWRELIIMMQVCVEFYQLLLIQMLL